jgi:glycosyltransferase involved in cell wall biosynthesis
MKVALITTELGLSGIPKYIELLALSLRKVGGVDPEVICFHPPLDRLATLRSHGVPVHVIFPNERRGSRGEFIHRLKSLLRSMQPDCVHTNGGNYNLITSWVLYRMGIPEVSTWHGWINKFSFVNFNQLLNLAKEIMLVHVQRFMGTQFITMGDHLTRPGISWRHKTTIVTGIPVQDKFVKDSTLPIILFEAARLVPGKGQEDLLRAVAMLPDKSNLEVWLAGDGPQKSALEKLAQDLSLHNVRFLGWRNDINTILQQTSIAVIPSYSESFGLFVLEGMMHGVPVVGYNIPAIKMLVKDNCGILVAPGDIAALSQALGRVIYNAELRVALGEAAHRRAVEHFSDVVFAKKTLGLYRQVCQQQASKRARVKKAKE